MNAYIKECDNEGGVWNIITPKTASETISVTEEETKG